MFGFGDKYDKYNDRENKLMTDYANAGLTNLFGTCDPQKLDQQMRKYMPELMGNISEAKNQSTQANNGIYRLSENQVEINRNINEKHDVIMEELRSLKLQNQKLQEKYNALVERMAAYIERENGKGR